MFGILTEKFQTLFSSLSGKKTLSEENMSDAIRQVRLALLDADVNYHVVSQFIQRVKEKAIGDTVLKSVTPGQQFIKLVHDELVTLMGNDETPLDLQGKISVIMVCGLQGSGKTTSCAKLAAFIKKTEIHKKILLVACDLQRPAAVEQLRKLGTATDIAVFSREGETTPLEVAKKALEKAKLESYDVLIVDTAGRLHLDDTLMKELGEMKALLAPREVLFVASAAMGQDAVRTAVEFDQKVQITGTILTMLDGSARAGAAISIREVTHKPLKFEGTGEKISDLQLFNPRSMADRILGMGDIINLVRKTQECIDEKESEEIEKKLRKATFTYEDYLKQMGMVKKMGSFKSLLKMVPGLGSLGNVEVSDKEFEKMEAIILSMTFRERQGKDELEFSRRRRIAQGSGVTLDEVNRLIKGFKRVKQLFKTMPMPDWTGKAKSFNEIKTQLRKKL